MTRAVVLVVGIALALLGCATPEPEPREPPPLIPARAEPNGRDVLVGRVAGAVERAVSRVREGLDEVRAAQRSLGAAGEHVAATLDKLADAPPAEGVGELASHAAELRARSASLMQRVEDLQTHLQAFELRAETQLAQDEDDPVGGGYSRRVLLDLEQEAVDLPAFLKPLLRSSDGLVEEVARLGVRVEQVRLRNPAPAPPPRQAPSRTDATAPPSAPVPQLVAEVMTSKGSLVLDLFPELAPHHVQNFVDLARSGFYDGLAFHRIIPGFLVQGGCPLGTGGGGPGYEIEAEFNDKTHVKGTLSMARLAHPDSAGSQFFLCLADRPELDGKYTVFGRLLKGERVLDAIGEVGTVSGVPIEPVIIEQLVIRPRRPADSEPRVAARDGR